MTQLHRADERWMRLAMAEAAKGIGRTSPNPAVGAILVQRGKIVAAGHHRGPGLPHAEVECLQQAPPSIRRNSTLYVTLEPCSSIGRTGPCTDAIIQAGISRVVLGAIDPNPLHQGAGVAQLRTAGVTVCTDVLADECAKLNEGFNKWIVTGQPFVIAKCGMTLDGRLTRPPGESRWLTSAAARQHGREIRSKVDAILVGAETIRRDDPRLTVRGRKSARQPWRVVLTRSGRLPERARIFTDRFAARTRIFRDQSLKHVLAALGRDNITSVLIEGGGDILGQALDEKLIDRLQIYFAPLFTGGPTIAFGGQGAIDTASALKLSGVRYEKIGEDVCMTGYAEDSAKPRG